MKSIQILLIALFALVAFIACERNSICPNEGKTGQPNFLPQKYEFHAKGGTVTLVSTKKENKWQFNNLDIKADNKDYKLYDADGKETDNIVKSKTIKSDWFKIEKESLQLITITAFENTTGKPRSVTLDIDRGNAWQVIEFSQGK